MRTLLALVLFTAACQAMPRVGDSEEKMLRELGEEQGKLVLPDDKVLYTFDRGTVLCQGGRVIELNITSDAEALEKKQAEMAKKREENARKAELELKARQAAADKLIAERKAAEAARQAAEAAEVRESESVAQFRQVAKAHMDELTSRHVIGLAPKGFGISKVGLVEREDQELFLELDFSNRAAIRITSVDLAIAFMDSNGDEIAGATLNLAIPSDNQVGFSVIRNFAFDQGLAAGTGRIAEAAARCAKLKALKDAEMVVVRIARVEPSAATQTVDITPLSAWLVKGAPSGRSIVDNQPGTKSGKPSPSAPPANAQYGSGMVFTREGHLFTNHHVVDGASACFVVVFDGNQVRQRLPAIVVATDKSQDLAILKVVGWSPPAGAPDRPPIIAKTSACKMGDPIFVLGYPLPGTLSSNVKYTKGDISDLTGAANNADELQHTAPIQPGNSGGPTCLTDGRVIGVVVSSLSPRFALATSGALPQGVNFSVKSDCLLKLAEKAGITVEPGVTSPDPVGHVKAYTVQLMCTK